MKDLIKKISWITLFSIAMGFLETAVVVYLRKIYYPAGFEFPLVPIDPEIAVTEFLREAATIIMLLGIGILSGRSVSERFAYFIYCFAIWDIFYYVFLKVLLNWPESLLTWDILFLIPVPWVGPVIAPCIISLAMIVLALSIVCFREKGKNTQISRKEWVFLITGSLIVIVSFMWDYFSYVFNGYPAGEVWTLSGKQSMFREIAEYVPVQYNWLLFTIGLTSILSGIVLFIRRVIKLPTKMA